MTKTHGWSGWCLTGRCKDCAYPGCGHGCHTQVEGQGELLPDPRGLPNRHRSEPGELL